MKKSKQLALLVMQILAILVGFTYVASFASDLISEKDDMMNIAGFATIIAVVGLAILMVTHYAEEFGDIFKKEQPDATKSPEVPDGVPVPNTDEHSQEETPATTQPSQPTTKGTPNE